MKKLLSIILCIMMVVTMIPATAFAEENMGGKLPPEPLFWAAVPDNIEDGEKPAAAEWSAESIPITAGQPVRVYFGIMTESGIQPINVDPMNFETSQNAAIKGRTNYIYKLTAEESSQSTWVRYITDTQDYEVGVTVTAAAGGDSQMPEAGQLYFIYAGYKVSLTNGNWLVIDGKTYQGDSDAISKVVDQWGVSSLHRPVGGIIGFCQADIILRDCFNSGDVLGNYAGGILGIKQFVGLSGKGIIEQCGNSGNIEGSECAGGIAGLLDERDDFIKVVKSCYNSGDVFTEGQAAGGIVGENSDYNIQNCYNSGTVSAMDDAILGGIVGFNGCTFTDSDYIGDVAKCYNVGTISGPGDYGGIVGFRKVGTVSDCYYLDTASKGIGNESADSLTRCSAERMKKKETFSNLDFATDWKFIQEYDYPVLYWQEGTLSSGTDNDNIDYILGDINLNGAVDASDLTALARYVAKIEELTDTHALFNSDVTGDGKIDASDLTKLARFVAKIISSLK